MEVLRYTLLTDGSSDRALMPIVSWLLNQHTSRTKIQSVWADLRHLSQPTQHLAERIQAAVDIYPCDLLFVHRDAERMELVDRVGEISQAVAELDEVNTLPPIVCVVPIRMMEAWMLFDENAIRSAAGNPNGRSALELPRLRDVENLPNPKQRLERSVGSVSFFL